MRAAIIGAGFLGGEILRQFSAVGTVSFVTHNKDPKHANSIKFDFFSDDIDEILRDNPADIIFLPAKIEFVEDSKMLESAMEKFLRACGNRRLIYISSDGIFDGEKGNYLESDVPNPVTLYGRNLKICEDLIGKYSKNYCIVRPSYIYGFSGERLDSRLYHLSEAVKKGEQVERFSDMYKSPLSVGEVAEVISRLAISDFVGVVHAAGPRMSVYDFCKEGLEGLGLPSENLVPVKMPEERLVDFLPDTSLNFDLMMKFTGMKPMNIKEGLSGKS